MEYILAYIVGIILLFLIAKLLLVPIKIVWKMIVNALIGGITLILINLIGSFFGLHIDINIITSLITGFLGVPGVIVILLLQYIIL
jgi:inhibitor of the pro-sigma K processing machinery